MKKRVDVVVHSMLPSPPAGPANAKPKTPAEAELLQFTGSQVPSSVIGTGESDNKTAVSAAMAPIADGLNISRDMFFDVFCL